MPPWAHYFARSKHTLVAILPHQFCPEQNDLARKPGLLSHPWDLVDAFELVIHTLSDLLRSSQQLRYVSFRASRHLGTTLGASTLRVAGQASWASRALLLSIWMPCTACSPEPLAHEGADAEVYIRALCEDACSRWEDCAPLPSGFDDCSVEECIDRLSDELDRPCFEPKLEYSRCRVERESCEEYFAMTIQTGPETACYDVLVVSQTCIERHSDPG